MARTLPETWMCPPALSWVGGSGLEPCVCRAHLFPPADLSSSCTGCSQIHVPLLPVLILVPCGWASVSLSHRSCEVAAHPPASPACLCPGQSGCGGMGNISQLSSSALHGQWFCSFMSRLGMCLKRPLEWPRGCIPHWRGAVLLI